MSLHNVRTIQSRIHAHQTYILSCSCPTYYSIKDTISCTSPEEHEYLQKMSTAQAVFPPVPMVISAPFAIASHKASDSLESGREADHPS